MVSLRKKYMLLNPQVLKIQSTLTKSSDSIRPSMASSRPLGREYQMSMMGELKFFLGLQIRQQRNGIFISQEKYLKDVLRKFGMQDCKGVKIPMPTNGH